MSIFLRLWIASSLIAISATAAAADVSAFIPVCFMQTETGQMIDLSHLCGPDEDPTTSQSQSGRQPQPLPQQRRGRGAARRGV